MPRHRRYQTNAERQRAYRRRKRASVHFRSATPEWETPRAFFEELHREFNFTLDVCATADNAQCPRYFTSQMDGLKQAWEGVCWCNPPYGREIEVWLKKAYESASAGATVVCLLPARTDTRWWHDYVTLAQEVRYVRGRLRFGGSANSAPFPSAIVVFHASLSRKLGEE